MPDEKPRKQPEKVRLGEYAPLAPIEDLTPEEQDAVFDGMVQLYANPGPQIEARYAEIGRQTREALDQDRLSEMTRSGEGQKGDDGSKAAGREGLRPDGATYNRPHRER